MNDYKDMHCYRGDVYVRDSSSRDRLVEQNASLQYDGYDNTFLWVAKGLIYVAKFFYAAIENNEEKKNEYEKEMNKYLLSTDIPLDDGVFYVKADTLVEDKKATKSVNFKSVKQFDEKHGINVQHGKKK